MTEPLQSEAIEALEAPRAPAVLRWITYILLIPLMIASNR